MSTFIEILHSQAREQGDRLAFRFLDEGAGEDSPETVTYAELDLRARSIAAGLQHRGLEGERVLLLYPSSLRFVEAFLGCLYAGATAVPSPLPTGQAHHVDRLVGIVRDADVGLVLTAGEAVDAVAPLLAQVGADHLECEPTDDEAGARADDWSMPAIRPDTLAFLQYTSGATGTPRGVMVSQANLAHNQRLIQRAFGTDSQTRSGGWLPFYHDMGLIGQVLGALFVGTSAVLMSPITFLLRPYRWLETISRYSLEVSGGPSFAYDLCTRRVTDEQLAGLDLSSWRLAYNGAEPVRAETMRAFAERFAPAGFDANAFYPCYGMAETTLFVSGGDWRLPPRTLSADAGQLEQGTITAPADDAPAAELVSCGTRDWMDVRIVDPETGAELPPGEIGEIWIRGESVVGGYWAAPDATAEVFGVATSAGEGGFLRSGDLGAVVDGELFVTGRRKEVVILNGRNIYPQDVEEEVRAAHQALAGRPGAAFSVEAAAGERLVVVQSVRRGDLGDEPERVVAAIRERLGRALGTRVGAVVLVNSRAILRTTSGKIQRLGMRSLFVEDRLAALHEDLDAELAERYRRAPGAEAA